MVVSFQDVLVADVALKTVVDGFEVDREGVVAEGDIYRSVFKHGMEDGSPTCSFFGSKVVDGEATQAQGGLIAGGGYGFRHNQYGAIGAAEGKTAVRQACKGRFVVFLVDVSKIVEVRYFFVLHKGQSLARAHPQATQGVFLQTVNIVGRKAFPGGKGAGFTGTQVVMVQAASFGAQPYTLVGVKKHGNDVGAGILM